jgi:hypothetical protein
MNEMRPAVAILPVLPGRFPESVGGVAVDSDDSEEQIRNPDTLMVI